VEGAHGVGVVAPVGEHVEVLLAGASGSDPAVVLEEHRRGVVHDRDAVGGDDAGLEVGPPVDVVEGAGGAAEVAGRLPVPPPSGVGADHLDDEPAGGEGAAVVAEARPAGGDGDAGAVPLDRERRRGEVAADGEGRRAVLGARPRDRGIPALDAEQAVGEDGDAPAVAVDPLLLARDGRAVREGADGARGRRSGGCGHGAPRAGCGGVSS
jgi:hypothetical protein